jgi:hypothetical protein
VDQDVTITITVHGGGGSSASATGALGTARSGDDGPPPRDVGSPSDGGVAGEEAPAPLEDVTGADDTEAATAPMSLSQLGVAGDVAEGEAPAPSLEDPTGGDDAADGGAGSPPEDVGSAPEED